MEGSHSEKIADREIETPPVGVIPPPEDKNLENLQEAKETVGELSQSPSEETLEHLAQIKNGRILSLEKKIALDAFDTEAWQSLLAEAHLIGDIKLIRDCYERFLKQFPTSSRHWITYAEFELNHNNFANVESIFTRCLRSVPSIELWKFYLNYIRRMNSGENGSAAGPDVRAVVGKAYEFVLQHIGIDKEAGPIWSDYLFFLRTGETHNTWEEQQKMDLMRKTYQKAITIPLVNVEHIWKEYDSFENGLNKLTAKKFLAERSPSYMTARTALREMRTITDSFAKNVLPQPPQWTDREIQQLEAWKHYITWERSNPLQLEDKAALSARVIYAYKQALIALRYYPEIWYDFAIYCAECGKTEEAVAHLKAGTEVVPTSLLLHFAYAELEESKKNNPRARELYEILLKNIEKYIEEIRTSGEQEINELVQSLASEEVENEEDSERERDGEDRERLRVKERSAEKQKAKVEAQIEKNLMSVKKAFTLVWIMFMKYARRAEGIKAARQIFSRARKSPDTTYHLFISSALMEYYCSKDQNIAGKIFELGLKTYASEPGYVLQYLEYLIQMNDDNNIRALFERALTSLSSDKAVDIWKVFIDYENKYGDLTSIQKIERRMTETYTTETALGRFVDRYSYLDINYITESELGINPGEDKKTKTRSLTMKNIEPMTAERSKDLNARQHGRRALLDPIHPERYPRPDFNQWTSYKPPVDSLRRGQPGAQGQSPLPTAPSGSTTAPSVNSSRPNIPPGLPEAVGFFMTQLPTAQAYNGPLINTDDLLDLILTAVIPGQTAPPSAPAHLPPTGSAPPTGPSGGSNFAGRGGRGGLMGNFSKRVNITNTFSYGIYKYKSHLLYQGSWCRSKQHEEKASERRRRL
ncbi:mRNA 3'-end-processing protein rna14, variant 2 [Basidiobolus ranarum]|uniref:mRNA 3'-end-processing protein rna14, variant 2 n=1 Tax=Basidiobolus ranarum TaxID=34480 RepID=A0ABR2W230_9FUNG